MHVHIRFGSTQPRDVGVCSCDNVRRAWLPVKRRFPLPAAEVQEGDSSLYLVLREENVASLREGDVTIGTVTSFTTGRALHK
ncbi:hypothetical protein BDN67DRAFT_1070165 [Paxillus ammoniavirescens]|nr:hypothetical protein BDN67DRAFT_1070165 [Paxillus ammoniavirescens]